MPRHLNSANNPIVDYKPPGYNSLKTTHLQCENLT